MHPFLPQQKLFKAYDIRGDVRYFTDDFVMSLGHSFARVFPTNSTVVIGYDVRLHSQSIARILAYQLTQQNIKVIWLGQVTTPMMAFMANEAMGNGLMVTASHSERHINGIKWLVNHESPSSQDIADLFTSLADTKVHLPSPALLYTIDHFPFEITPSLDIYQQGIMSAVANINQSVGVDAPQTKLKLVIDCLNGATSLFAKSVFDGLGYSCIVLNDIPDGSFPKGNPDPTEAGRLTELCQSVIEHQADIGLAFDGDGDRLMVVDSKGNIVAPDDLLYLLANLAITQRSLETVAATPAVVIFDVKCSHHLPTLIKQQNAIPLMEKTGSSLMRKSLQNKSKNAIFAGELSGHFIFSDGYFILHDDAMYAGIRLLNWLQYQSKSLAEIIAELPSSVSTADMYLPIDTAEFGQTVISQVVAKAKNTLAILKTPMIPIDEYQNPILAHASYQTPLTEFLAKQKEKKKKIKFSNALPFFSRPFQPKHITTIDGLRVDFAQGFGILRKSNTGNFLTVRFAGNTLADLKKIQQIFVELCQDVDEKLARQVAQIQPQHF